MSERYERFILALAPSRNMHWRAPAPATIRFPSGMPTSPATDATMHSSRHARFILLCLTLFAPLAQATPCASVEREDALQTCLSEAYTSADKALNQTYARLRGALDNDTRAMLSRAQKQWIALRDADCEFEASSYQGGSGYQAIYLQCQLDATVQRTARLRHSNYWPGD